jgi:hypothetical protein
MMDALRNVTKLAEMDAVIKDFRDALTVPFIMKPALIIGGRVVLDIVAIGDKWRVNMRGVVGGSIEVPAPSAAGGGRVANPFCQKKVADRMEFWFMKTACWCELFIGGRIRRCNATSEIVNNILKNNSMEEKSNRMVGRCKVTPG